jgi:glycosyltransferase involved in cell wall biosynthesis
MNTSRIAMFLPSLDGGGAERVFVELANYMAGQGIPVDLVLATATGPYLGEVRAPVRVVDCAATGVGRALPALARHLRRERCAAVLSALEHANVVALAARIVALSPARSVVSVRGVPTMLAHEAGARAASWVLRASRLAYRFAHAIIANSHGVADDMAAHLGIARRRIDVIYNPLDLEFIERQSAVPLSHPFCAPGAPPLLLSAGRLSPLKDFPTLVRAFARLRASRPCRLVILGEGPDRAMLEQLVRELGVGADVALPGFDPNPFAWMRHAAAFVSSSLSEGCPNALMQALACGTPVISTRAIGGSVEILADGRWGRLVPVADPQALAAAMAATLDDTAHPDVRRRARDFSMPRVAREYLAVLLPGEYARGAA